MAVFSQTPSFLAFFYLLYPPTTYLTRGYPSDLRFAQVVVAPPTPASPYQPIAQVPHLGDACRRRIYPPAQSEALQIEFKLCFKPRTEEI
jgi:hypothetical protein